MSDIATELLPLSQQYIARLGRLHAQMSGHPSLTQESRALLDWAQVAVGSLELTGDLSDGDAASETYKHVDKIVKIADLSFSDEANRTHPLLLSRGFSQTAREYKESLQTLSQIHKACTDAGAEQIQSLLVSLANTTRAATPKLQAKGEADEDAKAWYGKWNDLADRITRWTSQHQTLSSCGAIDVEVGFMRLRVFKEREALEHLQEQGKAILGEAGLEQPAAHSAPSLLTQLWSHAPDQVKSTMNPVIVTENIDLATESIRVMTRVANRLGHTRGWGVRG